MRVTFNPLPPPFTDKALSAAMPLGGGKRSRGAGIAAGGGPAANGGDVAAFPAVGATERASRSAEGGLDLTSARTAATSGVGGACAN